MKGYSGRGDVTYKFQKEDYRPMRLFPVESKIFERIMRKIVFAYIMKFQSCNMLV